MIAQPIDIVAPRQENALAILIKAREESAQKLMMVYAITGLFFMLLRGTFLDVCNLISISGHHSIAISAVHSSFPVFVRVAYVWLLTAAGLGICAAYFDHAHGWVGASRHALTVGFVAAVVFAIGQRVLPAFAGMGILYKSSRRKVRNFPLLGLH